MVGLDFEGAVIRPYVDGCRNAGYTTLVDLGGILSVLQ